MNKSNLLFEIADLSKSVIQKKIKKIPLKQWNKWEMNETFIEALYAMNADKVFVFKIVYRKGELNYSIESGRDDYKSGSVTKDDIKYIMEFFVNRGWEVDSKYYEAYGGGKILTGLCIRSKK